MDKAERTRLKQLANDAIIDLFGADSHELKLAEALERAIDHVEYLRTQWRPICDGCETVLMTYEEVQELESA